MNKITKIDLIKEILKFDSKRKVGPLFKKKNAQLKEILDFLKLRAGIVS